MNKIQLLVVIFAVLAMIKAVWMLAAPSGFKAFVRVWLRSAERLTTLLPVILVVIGIAIWALILIDQPIYVSLAALFGAFCLLGAFVYAHPEVLSRWANRMIVNRSPTALRWIAAVILVLSGLILWTAVTGK